MFRAKPRRWGFVVVALVSATVVTGCDLNSFMPGTPRPAWCDPTDTAINDGHTADFFAAYTTTKGPLSGSQCIEVVDTLTTAAAFAARFPTVGAAKAAGWVQETVYTPGQGVHFVDPTRQTGPFNPRMPNRLLYNGTANTAALAGMMFLVQSGELPPAGFPGGNDHWHNHGMLCYKAGSNPYIIGEGFSDSTCASFGGVNTDFSDWWMVHAWLPVYAGWQAPDIFHNSHPSL